MPGTFTCRQRIHRISAGHASLGPRCYHLPIIIRRRTFRAERLGCTRAATLLDVGELRNTCRVVSGSLAIHADLALAGNIIRIVISGRPARLHTRQAGDTSQLSAACAFPFLLRVYPPGNSPVLHRGRSRRTAFLACTTLDRLPACQGCGRQASVWYADECLRASIRVDEPLDCANRDR